MMTNILLLICNLFLVCIFCSCRKPTTQLETERYHVYVVGGLNETYVLLKIKGRTLVAANLTASHENGWALYMPISANESDMLMVQAGGYVTKQLSNEIKITPSRRYIIVDIQKEDISFQSLDKEPTFD